jgi:hypothetical protein
MSPLTPGTHISPAAKVELGVDLGDYWSTLAGCFDLGLQQRALENNGLVIQQVTIRNRRLRTNGQYDFNHDSIDHPAFTSIRNARRR